MTLVVPQLRPADSAGDATDPVFIVAPEQLAGVAVGDEIHLGGAEAHHAFRVRRLRAGEAIQVIDGRGCRIRGHLGVDTGTGRVPISVVGIDQEPARQPRIVIAQALIKGDRADRAIETMTEVGVDEIIPWTASRCVVQWRGDKQRSGPDRWASIAREATKQSRQAWVPQIAPVMSLAQLCDRVHAASTALVLDVTGEPLLLDGSSDEGSAPGFLPLRGDVLVVVGPEGGLTETELQQLQAAGARVIRLGSNVLRSATAGTIAAAVIIAGSMRWGHS